MSLGRIFPPLTAHRCQIRILQTWSKVKKRVWTEHWELRLNMYPGEIENKQTTKLSCHSRAQRTKAESDTRPCSRHWDIRIKHELINLGYKDQILRTSQRHCVTSNERLPHQLLSVGNNKTWMHLSFASISNLPEIHGAEKHTPWHRGDTCSKT